MRKCFMFVLLLLFAAATQAQTWKPLGPPGGDARSLAVDPSHPDRLFLGTADGHIFGSEDTGAHWSILGRVSTRLDEVVTSIAVDPRDGNIVYASAWTQDPTAGGGVFRSSDRGKTWSNSGMEGQAVRALAIAPSDPNIFVAGTLDGVYTSSDAGKTWTRSSPEHHEELRNFDSLAIDPRDAQTIYAGTYHLPWKTTDGGRNWRPIHEGMIDDSDVMSILIDASNPAHVYASACSGIYRSDNAAGQWRKIQGIPYTARRTYAITQDPNNPATVYAATSEGLWKTTDAGMTWRRTTPQTWVVNAVSVIKGAKSRVVIGTEQLGVLTSDDGGEHFQEANGGFFHRQILALALDGAHPGRILAVLAHAPEPILATDNDGVSWEPLGPGLSTEQMLRVYASPDGWWATLAHGGLMRYDAQKKIWQRAGSLVRDAAAASQTSRKPIAGSRVPLGPSTSSQKTSGTGSPTAVTTKLGGPARPLQQVVTDMAFGPNTWYAATDIGLLASSDHGTTWDLKPLGPLSALPVQSVRTSTNGERLWVVSLRGLVFSADGGKTWAWHDLPLGSGGAISLDVDDKDENTMISIAHNGLYISRDGGATWQQAASGLPSIPVRDFASAGNVFLASMRAGGLYVSSDSGRRWNRVAGTLADGFFPAVTTKSGTGVIFAASATEGLYSVEWSGSAMGSNDASLQPGK